MCPLHLLRNFVHYARVQNLKYFLKFFFLKRFIYLFERKRMRAQAEMDKGRGRKNSEADLALSVKPDSGLDPTTVRS